MVLCMAFQKRWTSVGSFKKPLHAKSKNYTETSLAQLETSFTVVTDCTYIFPCVGNFVPGRRIENEENEYLINTQTAESSQGCSAVSL